MDKVLFCGDLHAQMNNIEDTISILDLIIHHASNETVDSIVFLGDIFHSHSVVRQEIAFIVRDKILKLLEQNKKVFLLAGNHDGSSPHSVELNAVRLVFDNAEKNNNNLCIVDKLTIYNKFAMIPFYGDHPSFLSQSNEADANLILVCHQTVKGAYYENKTLAPDGIDQTLIKQRKIITGHIHMEQTVGKAFYPGTPRALNANEYNEPKGIWLFDNSLETFEKISTDHLVKLFYRYDINETNIDTIVIDSSKWKSKDDVRFAISGTEAFYKSAIEKYKEFNGQVRFIPNIRQELGKKIDVESEGTSIELALKHYVHDIYDVDVQLKGKIWTALEKLIQAP